MRPLIAPTEPAAIRALGRVSSLPERVGCDVLWWAKGKKCGVQRKEVRDLIASVGDGRLARELGQMEAAGLGARLLIVEGKVPWSLDGVMMSQWGQSWTRRQWKGLLWSICAANAWVSETGGLSETAETISWFMTWCAKEHRALVSRPGPGKIWGTNASDREWGEWLLQGLPGVGPEIARRIMGKFGRVPLRWDTGRDEMMEVEGLGARKVAAMWRVLDTTVGGGDVEGATVDSGSEGDGTALER